MPDVSESHGRFWEAIARKGPARAACDAGAEAEGGRILLPLAGIRYSVDPGARTVRREGPEGPTEAGFSESVVLVSHLALADGSPRAGEWVSEKGLDLGDVFFRPPHRLPAGELASRFGPDPEGFLRAARALGGREIRGGDRAAEIPALPRVPLRVLLWLGDEEFPEADARFLFDRSASRNLLPDGILTLVWIVEKRLLEAARAL
jgi:hypothetical protein